MLLAAGAAAKGGQQCPLADALMRRPRQRVAVPAFQKTDKKTLMFCHFQLSYRRCLGVQLFVYLWSRVEHILLQNLCLTTPSVQHVVEMLGQVEHMFRQNSCSAALRRQVRATT